MARDTNHGLRKLCGCSRRKWAKCSHSWYFNFKPRGGQSYRFSVDVEAGKHIASKTEAEALAEGWRLAIREGTFTRRGEQPAASAVTDAPLTLEGFAERYFERRGKPATKNDRSCLRRLSAFALAGQPFGQKALDAITEDDVEAFFASLRAAGKAASTRNKYVQLTKALFRWAAKKGYLARNPIADSEALGREQMARRDRRLEPAEEETLLANAGAQLQRLIIAALETGCRRGELLSLTWADVNLPRREITIRAERSKTRTGRVLPVSARLLAVIEMGKTDPAGEDFGPDKFVFGDTVGQQVKDIKRAWETCVLKAHGHQPSYNRANGLAAASREALKNINLTFHDLRHEAGSRLLEAGWPLHNVSHMLGHANIAQTSTYLNATRVGLQDSMRRLDEARGCNSVAKTEAPEHPPLGNEATTSKTQTTVN